MIEDAYSLEASADELRAYVERRLHHIGELNKRIESALADIAHAQRRIVTLEYKCSADDPPN